MRWRSGGWLCPEWEVPAGFCTAFKSEKKPCCVAQACSHLTLLTGLQNIKWTSLKQIHSTKIHKAEAEGTKEGDGLWTEEAGLGLVIQTADCVPVLLLDKKKKRVAALHAGWRGVLGGIVSEQLKSWLGEGGRPEDIQVALGPCIGPCCYEVNEALAESFVKKYGGDVVSRPTTAPSSKPSLHLTKALEHEVLSFGIHLKNIQFSQICTFCDTRFYSYRREPQAAGRQLSWIACVF